MSIWIRAVAAFAVLNAVLVASISYMRWLNADGMVVSIAFAICEVVIVGATLWFPIYRALWGSESA